MRIMTVTAADSTTVMRTALPESRMPFVMTIQALFVTFFNGETGSGTESSDERMSSPARFLFPSCFHMSGTRAMAGLTPHPARR